MNKYSQLLLSQAGIVFILTFAVLFFVYKRDKESGFVKARHRIYNSFSFRAVVYILIAALAITYVVSQFSYSGLTTALVFVAVLGLAPLLLSNAKKRNEQEELFSEVVLFCQNTGMLLKQTHNPYKSIKNASEDLETILRDDIRGLLSAMEAGREDTINAMAVLEKNYPYSCIKNLNIIILHMYYENANVDDTLLTTYQDDVTVLEQDIRRNKLKRRSLRLSYIIITVGSVAAYWFFVGSLSETFSDSFNNDFYRVLNMFYIFGTMIAFFFVDRYFNLNTTKE